MPKGDLEPKGAIDIMVIWETDQLAARKLLASLRLDPDDANLRIAAEAFSLQRELICEWTLKIVGRDAVEALETESIRSFPDRAQIWNDGFMYAQQCLRKYFTQQNFRIDVVKSLTRGQILRNMVGKLDFLQL